ncbi:NUDIX hydrolase [Gluconacetobacter sp. Hr-1-5]|uniref:NUDIX hydrolase n=1 Tax=Gluconacetobacter sp. Hr-1-5 TaxID=3395370 RepID=UPI003B52F887
MSGEPDWLVWGREIQAIAQTGLTFARDPFDRERYEALRMIAAQMMAAGCDEPVARIEALFAGQEGYATPKVEVRAAVFDDSGRILMVREVLDEGRWTLPGGWADVNLTPAENAVKEVREESGYIVTARRLAAVWDRTRQGHGSKAFSCAKFFFLCDLAGGEAATSVETSEIAWFGAEEIPEDLSLGRVLPGQIRRMFDHYREPGLPADFE